MEEKECLKAQFPYISGVRTITAATATGTYPNDENIFKALGRPATGGVIRNFGTGTLFVVLMREGGNRISKEIQIQNGKQFRWRGADVYFISLRADADSTTYEVIAGPQRKEGTPEFELT